MKCLEELTEWIQSYDPQFMDQPHSDAKNQPDANLSSILIPRLPGYGGFESAKLLDTLVLLYDRLYWQSPHNSLLIRDSIRDNRDLAKYGVDENFPERFIEYVRQGIIVGLTNEPGGYSLPAESAEEYEFALNVLYTGTPPLEWYRDRELLNGLTQAYDDLRKKEAQSLGNITVQEIILPLFLNIGLTRVLNMKNIFVANYVEETQWRILHSFFSKNLEIPETTMSLGTESMIRLLEGILLMSPCRLPVDVVLELRDNIGPTRLRNWIKKQAENASHHLLTTDPVDYMLDEFNDNVVETVAKAKNSLLFKISFGGVAAAVGTFFGGIPGAIMGATAGVGASVVADTASLAWSRRYKELGWILRIHEFRSQVRSGKFRHKKSE